MAHVVITGGAGFVGSHLCDAFLARGDSVTAVDNLLTGKRENIQHLDAHPDFTFLEQDVIEGIHVEGAVDAILHFASPASPKDYLLHPIKTLKVGSIGTHNTLELARQKKARFLLASTSEVYGDPKVYPQPETYWGNVNPISPRGVYDEAKRYAEACVMAYRKVHGVETRIVRIFNTYGPRMRINDGRVLPAFVSAAERGEPLRVHGDGSQTRSFCFVSDTVEGIQTVLDHSDGYPVNVGAPGEMTILEFAHLVLELSGHEADIVHEDPMVDDPKRREPDITRAQALGWTPRVSLRDGLTRTLDWFREREGQPAGGGR